MSALFFTLPLREGRNLRSAARQRKRTANFGEGCARQRARFARDPSPKNPLSPLRDAPEFFDPPSRGGWDYGETS